MRREHSGAVDVTGCGEVSEGDAVHARLRELGAAGAANEAAHVEQRSLREGSVDLF